VPEALRPPARAGALGGPRRRRPATRGSRSVEAPRRPPTRGLVAFEKAATRRPARGAASARRHRRRRRRAAAAAAAAANRVHRRRCAAGQRGGPAALAESVGRQVGTLLPGGRGRMMAGSAAPSPARLCPRSAFSHVVACTRQTSALRGTGTAGLLLDSDSASYGARPGWVLLSPAPATGVTVTAGPWPWARRPRT
jgi:hypothetical protein